MSSQSTRTRPYELSSPIRPMQSMTPSSTFGTTSRPSTTVRDRGPISPRAARASVDALKLRVEAQEAEIGRLRAQYADMLTLKRQEIAALQRKTADSSKRLDASAAFRTTVAPPDDTSGEVAMLRRRIKTLENYLVDVPTPEEHRNALGDLEAALSRNRKLEERVKAREAELKTVEREVRAECERSSALHARIPGLKQTLEELEMTAQTTRRPHEHEIEQESEIRELRRNLTDLRVEMSEKDGLVARLNDEMDELRKEKRSLAEERRREAEEKLFKCDYGKFMRASKLIEECACEAQSLQTVSNQLALGVTPDLRVLFRASETALAPPEDIPEDLTIEATSETIERLRESLETLRSLVMDHIAADVGSSVCAQQ